MIINTIRHGDTHCYSHFSLVVYKLNESFRHKFWPTKCKQKRLNKNIKSPHLHFKKATCRKIINNQKQAMDIFSAPSPRAEKKSCISLDCYTWLVSIICLQGKFECQKDKHFIDPTRTSCEKCNSN